MTGQSINSVMEEPNVWIPLSDGVKLAARIWRPADAEESPVPAILEYLPYRKRDGTAPRDEKNHPYFAQNGYACIRVDMRGSGESDGLMEDEYTLQEQDDAIAVIDWIAAQPWCSGAVGMIGISWGGFNGLQVAARRPPALKAVVSIASTTDRYADDIHYKGGCMLVENFGWSQQMLSYMSRPPDPALVGAAWRAKWLTRLVNLPHLAETWMDHQHRDAYWAHGSICEDWSAIEAPVLIVGGLADGYMNAVMNILENLEAPRKGILGPWVHLYPNMGVPGPAIGFLQEALRWWDRWLKGEATGVEEDPDLRVFRREGVKPSAILKQAKGAWLGIPAWPIPGQKQHVLRLAGRRLVADEVPDRRELEIPIRSDQDVGTFGGEFFAWIGPDQPDDQRLDDAKSMVWDTVPLDTTLDVLGRPVLNARIKVDQPQALISLRLCDVNPDGSVMRVAYAVFNLSHRDGPEDPQPMPVGEWVTVSIPLDNTCHRFLPGHRIRLAASTSYWPMVWPAPAPVDLVVDTAATVLHLPELTDAQTQETAFQEPVSANPTPAIVHREPTMTRTVSHDLSGGLTGVEIHYDTGLTEEPHHGLRTGTIHRESYTIAPDDPLSARMDVHWTQTLSRGDWSVRTESSGCCTATQEAFVTEAVIKAYEGDDLVFERTWEKAIPRRSV